jgi:hypothetical protein
MFLYGREVNVTDNVHVTDLLDGDISHKIKPTLVSDSIVTSEGIHQMLFRITNSLGDTVELQLPIEIYPTGKYNAALSLTDYLVYVPVGSRVDLYDYLDHFDWGDESVSLNHSIPDDVRVQITGRVNTSVAGVYPVNYVVTYENGLSVYKAISKVIVVVEG